MKKIILIAVILISCESLISPLSNDESVNQNLSDYQKALSLMSDVDKSLSNAMNLFTYVVAISTDEAIESSSTYADDLLGKQIFDKENSIVNDAYNLWQDLYNKSKNAQYQLNNRLDLNDGFDNTIASNPAKTNLALKSVSLFHKGYALYKLGMNWKSARIDGKSYTSSQLLSIAKNVLDSAITVTNSESYSYNTYDYTKAANIIRLRIFLNDSDYNSVISQISRGNKPDVIIVKPTDDNVNLMKKNSNPVGTKMIFSPNYLPNDSRIPLISHNNIVLQGSTDSSFQKIYLQNKYKTLNQSFTLVNPDQYDNLMLIAEAKYHQGQYDEMVNLLNQVRIATASRTNPDSTITAHSTINVTRDIAKKHLLGDLLAEYFLRGQRIEVLRRFGIRPFKSTATATEYGFLPPSE